MDEIVKIVIESESEVMQVVTNEVIEQVNVYISDAPDYDPIAAGRVNKYYYTASGDESGLVIVPGVANPLWTQVTQGAIPLKEVESNPGSLEYSRSSSSFTFGDHPQAGENILFEWQ